MKITRALIVIAALVITACKANNTPPLHTSNLNQKWVALEGACFKMGEASLYQEETPVIETCVKPFEIQSHEVSHIEFSKFVAATQYKTRAERGWTAEEAGGPGQALPPSSAVFIPPKEQVKNMGWWKLVDDANWRKPWGPDGRAANPNTPVIHITREDAQAYAAWAGGRLPTEAEWEYAARGGLNGALMSWGDAEDAALAGQANTWTGVFPVINSEEDGYAGLAPVGSYPANGFGLYDMIGNAWEWTSSNYYPSHHPKTLPQMHPDGYDPAQKGLPVGVIKGGSFLCAKSYCYRYRPAARQAQDLAFGTSHIGFRLVRDITPKP